MPIFFTLAWTVVALFFSYFRSLWGDEWIRVDQSHLAVFNALRTLWSEPSPFAPGEILLNRFCALIFGWLPLEIWTRLPGVFFGAGYVWLSFQIAKAFKTKYLPVISFFSVPLLMLSAEMRSYGSLFFAGQVALALLCYKKDVTPKWVLRLAFVAAVFSHIYGVCFVAWSAFRRKHWSLFGVAVLTVAISAVGYFTLGAKNHVAQQSYYSVFELVRQSMGGLSNPHRSSLLFFGFGLIGLWELWRGRSTLTLDFLALGFFTVLCPIFATVASGYFFVPRQVIGGAGIVALFASVGLTSLEVNLSKKTRWTVFLPLIPMSLAPFFLSIILEKPPFPDQPRGKYRELTAEVLKDSAVKEVFVVSPCDKLSFDHYFSRKLGKASPENFERGASGESTLWKQCWPSGFCMSGFLDQKFCSASSKEIAGKVPSGFSRVFYPQT